MTRPAPGQGALWDDDAGDGDGPGAVVLEFRPRRRPAPPMTDRQHVARLCAAIEDLLTLVDVQQAEIQHLRSREAGQ